MKSYGSRVVTSLRHYWFGYAEFLEGLIREATTARCVGAEGSEHRHWLRTLLHIKHVCLLGAARTKRIPATSVERPPVRFRSWSFEDLR